MKSYGRLELPTSETLADLGIAGEVWNATTFTFNQSTPSSNWIIQHNLNRFPSVTIVDSAGTVVYGDVTYSDDSTIIVDFEGSAFAGKAYLN